MTYDAIIVGARCAGSPTAMLLARKGYKVLMVDKAGFPSDTMSGHYTQVIWAATTRVGCGRVTCTRQSQQWTLVVCNYSPRGNVLGQPVY